MQLCFVYHGYMVTVFCVVYVYILDCVACLVGLWFFCCVLKLYEFCVENQVFDNGVKCEFCLLRLTM